VPTEFAFDAPPPLPKRRARRKSALVPILVGAGVLVLLLGSGLALLVYVVRTANQNKGAAVYTKMPLDDLIDEWERNPAAASQKYRREGVEFSGELRRISSNIHGQTYIDVRGVKGGGDRSTHIFVIAPAANDGLVKCVVGGRIVVRAVGTGDAHDTPFLIADEIRPGPKK
jgi:hypothetical protein